MTTTPSTSAGTHQRSMHPRDGGARAIFASRVADYVASRPDYPSVLFDALRELGVVGRGARVADVGAGTGLLTRGLLQRGCHVVAVEPNPEMRHAADTSLGHLPGYRSVEGSAESMPLPTGSVDLVTAAQAFHWFDIVPARKEFLRVLAPKGQVALVWNLRVRDDPLHMALDEVFAEFGGARRTSMAVDRQEDRAHVEAFFGGAPVHEFTWPFTHALSDAAFMSLVYSRSYVPSRNDAAGPRVAHHVRQVFERFANAGSVTIRYRTVAAIGRPAAAPHP